MSNGQVIRAASVEVFPVEEQWSKEELLKVTGVPWAPQGTLKYRDDVAEVPEPARAPQELLHPPAAIVPRGFRITPELFGAYGHTPGCRKCTLMQNGRDSARIRHTDACRQRVMDEVRGDPARQAQAEEVEEKKTHYLEQALEEQSHKKRRVGGTEEPTSTSELASAPQGGYVPGQARLPIQEVSSQWKRIPLNPMVKKPVEI